MLRLLLLCNNRKMLYSCAGNTGMHCREAICCISIKIKVSDLLPMAIRYSQVFIFVAFGTILNFCNFSSRKYAVLFLKGVSRGPWVRLTMWNEWEGSGLNRGEVIHLSCIAKSSKHRNNQMCMPQYPLHPLPHFCVRVNLGSLWLKANIVTRKWRLMIIWVNRNETLCIFFFFLSNTC